MRLNNGYSYREQLNTKASGHTVLSYLEHYYTHSSKETWLERLQHGEVFLGNSVANGNELLQAGQTLIWHRPPWVEEDTPQTFEIIYQDDALLVVSKPSGLPSVPAGGFLENTLFSFVRKEFKTAQPLHRLGRGTSGLVVFALTDEANTTVSKAWRKHEVEKHYRALASGLAAQDEYHIDAPIGLVDHSKLGEVYAASETGKASSSLAKVLERASTNSAHSTSSAHSSTLFSVQIFTGRAHQIRIHLAFIGHPLVGDALYSVGGKPLENAALPGEGGYLLHAERLKFLHPTTKKWLELCAEPPKELKRLT
jgi:23S rRNA pseudouridine1911/1915/1917 synthase